MSRPLRDLHVLPKTRDSLSFLYVEHCRIEQDAYAIAVVDADRRVPVPCASLSVLLLGPGTTITHAAVRALAESGCLAVWTGEEGVRTYAVGPGETRSARNLQRQARAWADPAAHMRVVRRLYELRFGQTLDPTLTLRQVRGLEGVRVRTAYAEASRATGVAWHGRTYDRRGWSAADPVNRALSCANSALYGIVHAAIVAAGYSPALGFVHTGKMLSFVYDIADLYKAEVTIPAAFMVVAEGEHDIERRTRLLLRDTFHAVRLMARLVPDIEAVLEAADLSEEPEVEQVDEDAATPADLWGPEGEVVEGGRNFAVPTPTGDDQ